MASGQIAVEYVLRQEDRKLTGVITTDSGGRTRFGVAEKYHPELTNTGFFDTMATPQALELAVKVYNNIYLARLSPDKITCQAILNSLLSYAINMGVSQAVKLLQRTIGTLEDGEIGPMTLQGVNSLLPHTLLIAWRGTMQKYYAQLVKDRPEDKPYLNGWLNRVSENTMQSA